jgi:hypothetical protein
MQGAAFQFDPEAFKPVIEQAVDAAMLRLESARAIAGGKLCYSEAEAAALLGLKEHQLRDERLRGRINASSIVCRRIRYTYADLMEYLMSRRWAKDNSYPNANSEKCQ